MAKRKVGRRTYRNPTPEFMRRALRTLRRIADPKYGASPNEQRKAAETIKAYEKILAEAPKPEAPKPEPRKHQPDPPRHSSRPKKERPKPPRPGQSLDREEIEARARAKGENNWGWDTPPHFSASSKDWISWGRRQAKRDKEEAENERIRQAARKRAADAAKAAQEEPEWARDFKTRKPRVRDFVHVKVVNGKKIPAMLYFDDSQACIKALCTWVSLAFAPEGLNHAVIQQSAKTARIDLPKLNFSALMNKNNDDINLFHNQKKVTTWSEWTSSFARQNGKKVKKKKTLGRRYLDASYKTSKKALRAIDKGEWLAGQLTGTPEFLTKGLSKARWGLAGAAPFLLDRKAWSRANSEIAISPKMKEKFIGEFYKRVTQAETRANGGSRILYHIGPRPPEPKPFRHSHLSDHRYETLNAEAGVFLTPDPLRVGMMHSIKGHVYAVEVPNSVIKKAGGIQEYDSAAELILTPELWEEVTFLGKSMDAKEFDLAVKAGWKITSSHREASYSQQQAKNRVKAVARGESISPYDRPKDRRRNELDLLRELDVELREEGLSKEEKKKRYKSTRKSLEKRYEVMPRVGLRSRRNGAKGRRNPWKETDRTHASPCRRCGGAGEIAAYYDVLKGVCFNCNGTGLVSKDWRSSEPERFELLGSPVLVFDVKGGLKVLIREKDFQEFGTSMLRAGWGGQSGRKQKVGDRDFVTTTFFVKNGKVSGATLRWSGKVDKESEESGKWTAATQSEYRRTWWEEAPLVAIPEKVLQDHFQGYHRYVRWETEEERPKDWRTVVPKIRAADEAMAKKITAALQAHYGRR